ncbi:hypothetical protein [Streptomyces africanus]|uniref:hypothetical protein n=1 Tax=Streptomyces africanus TaxID=231024 RepID=UPI0031344B57
MWAGTDTTQLVWLQLARIRALVIPPAWRDVWICTRANGHLQAVGTMRRTPPVPVPPAVPCRTGAGQARARARCRRCPARGA